MEKWFLFLLLAVLSNQALCFKFKDIQEADSDDSSTLKNLEEKYVWNKPILYGRPVPDGQWLGVYLFPLQQLLRFNQGRQPDQSEGQSSTPSLNENGSTQSSSFQKCLRNCPVTPEYNPVCGSDGITYPNPGRLGCAQFCRKNVTLFRESRCPDNMQSN